MACQPGDNLPHYEYDPEGLYGLKPRARRWPWAVLATILAALLTYAGCVGVIVVTIAGGK